MGLLADFVDGEALLHGLFCAIDWRGDERVAKNLQDDGFRLGVGDEVFDFVGRVGAAEHVSHRDRDDEKHGDERFKWRAAGIREQIVIQSDPQERDRRREQSKAVSQQDVDEAQIDEVDRDAVVLGKAALVKNRPEIRRQNGRQHDEDFFGDEILAG